jgi:stage IV sporulation protein FB
MSWSIKLFRIKGIDIKLHLTFVLILVWAAYRWGVSQGKGLEGALFGVVVTSLLFLGVTLHELGHSFQALRFGVPVKDITLWPFGGLAQMERMPEEPDQELRIAISGPLVNLAIGLGLALLGALLSVQGWLGVDRLYQALGDVSWQGLLAYLVTANLALALFNLIPAFPMDGGRVLRALLAKRTDYRQATRWAVKIGQTLAWGLGLWGFMSGGFTLIFIAIFVYMAAGQEGKATEAKSVLGDLRVGQAMSRQVQTLTPADPLSRAVDLTLQTMQADFPVVDDGQLVGFLTEQALLKGLRERDLNQPVSQVMQIEFTKTSPDMLLFDAQQQMAKARTRAIPVTATENGHLAGLLTDTDINEVYHLFSANPQLVLAAN